MQQLQIKSTDATIGTANVTIAGELMKNQAPATIVDAQHQMKVVKDMNGEPMIFAIGADGILYAYLRNKNSKTGWQQYDLSSSLAANNMATAFEVAQGFDGKLQLGVAIAPKGNPAQAQLYLTPLITNDTQLTDWSKVQKQWVARPFQGNTQITSILIGRNDGKSDPLALVVTQNGTTAQHFQVNTNVQDTTWIWKEYKMPENAVQILEIAVGTVFGTWGVYALYQTTTGKTLEFTSLPDPVFHKTSSYQFVLPADANSIKAVPGTGNSYDLYAAGDGIYLYKDSKSTVTTVAAASVIQDIHTLIVEEDSENVTVWTINQDEVLQYTQGTKSNVNPWSMPIPISQKVTQMAAARNDIKLTNELFVVKGDNTLWYIYQDPASSLWRETQIPLPSLSNVIHQNTYTTHVSLKDQNDQPLFNKTVQLTSSNWIYATVNGELHSVDSKSPISVNPDMQGNITIIVEVDSIAVPVFQVTADFLSTPININPGSKVIDGLQKIQNGGDLKNATLQDGKPLLDKSIDDDTLNSAATAVQQLTKVSGTLPSDGSASQPSAAAVNTRSLTPSGQLIGFQNFGGRVTLHEDEAAYQLLASVSGATAAIGERGLGDLEDSILIDIGDFFAWVESGLIKAGEWFLNILEVGAEFLINIGGKIFKFIIQAVEEVFEVINWVLKETLGIDLEKFIKWLGFIFNWDDIKLTHQVLVNLANQTINYGKSKIEGIESQVAAWFEQLKTEAQKLEPYDNGDTHVQDQAQRIKDGQSQTTLSVVSSLFNSPGSNWGTYHMQHSGVFDQTYPDASPQDPISAFFNDILYPTLDSIKDTVQQLMNDLQDAYKDKTLTFNQIVQKLAADSIIGILDALEKIAVGILKFIEDLIGFLQAIINAKIDIPFFSGFYKWLAGADLTILDAICLILAVPVTIIYKLAFQKAPFADGTYNFLSNDFNLIFNDLTASTQSRVTPNPVAVRSLAEAAVISRGDGDSTNGNGNNNAGVTAAKVYSYIGGIGYALAAGVANVLTLLAAFAEADLAGEGTPLLPEKKEELENKVSSYQKWIAGLNLAKLAGAFPVGDDDEVDLQRTVWGIYLGSSLIEIGVSVVGNKFPATKTVGSVGLGIYTIAKSITVMVLEGIIFGKEINSKDPEAQKEQGTNIIKLIQNILYLIGELAEGGIKIAAPFAKDPESKAALTLPAVISGGGYVIASFLDAVRVLLNGIDAVEHQNF